MDGVIIPYQIGEEIDHYPVAELSVNFTSWNVTKQFHESGIWLDAANDSSLVIFRFTLRNTSNYPLNLSDPDFFSRLTSAYLPILNYRGAYGNGSYYGGKEQVKCTDTWINSLFPDEPILSSTFEANQTANGILIYQTLDGHQPTWLTLKDWTPDSNVMLELELE